MPDMRIADDGKLVDVTDWDYRKNVRALAFHSAAKFIRTFSENAEISPEQQKSRLYAICREKVEKFDASVLSIDVFRQANTFASVKI